MSFGHIIGIATLIVVATTLIVYGIQAQELVKQTRLLTHQMKVTDGTQRAQVSLSTNSMMHTLSRMLLDYPELRSYFYGDKPVPDEEPLRARVLLTAEMFIDFMATTLDHAPFFPDQTYAGWRRYFQDLVAGSASLRYWWTESRDWYEPPVRELLDPVVFGGGRLPSVGAEVSAPSSQAETGPAA